MYNFAYVNCIMKASVNTHVTASTDISLGNWCGDCKNDILEILYPSEDLE